MARYLNGAKSVMHETVATGAAVTVRTGARARRWTTGFDVEASAGSAPRMIDQTDCGSAKSGPAGLRVRYRLKPQFSPWPSRHLGQQFLRTVPVSSASTRAGVAR